MARPTLGRVIACELALSHTAAPYQAGDIDSDQQFRPIHGYIGEQEK